MLRRIAVGGMAELFLAEQAAGDTPARRVVIKRALPGADETFLTLLRKERDVLARVHSEHVVRLLGGADDWMLLEYVEGADLSAVLAHQARRGRALGLGASLAVARDVLLGLADIHDTRDEAGAAMRLVHRDVNPANVLVRRSDGRVKLTDLGVVHVGLEGHPTLGGIKGTLAYMAPEQLLGKPVDRRSDIYAAGLVIWEALCGVAARPPGIVGVAELVYARSQRPAAPSSVRSSLPPALDAVVLSALEPAIEDRPDDARALWRALRDAAGPVEPDPAALAEVVGALEQTSGPLSRTLAPSLTPASPGAARTLAAVVEAPASPDEPAPSATKASPALLGWLVALSLAAALAFVLRPSAESPPSPMGTQTPSSMRSGRPTAPTPVPMVVERVSAAPERQARRTLTQEATPVPEPQVPALARRALEPESLASRRGLARAGRRVIRPRADTDNLTHRPPDPKPMELVLVVRSVDGATLYVSGAGASGLAPRRTSALADGAHVLRLRGGGQRRAVLRVIRSGERVTATIGGAGRYYEVQCGGRALGNTPVRVRLGRSITCRLTDETGGTLAFGLDRSRS